MKNKSIIILLLSLLPVLSGNLFSRDEAKITPYIQLQYFRNSDDQRSLKTTLTYSKNRMELPLPGMEISFYEGPGKKELLAKVVTDSKGVAVFDPGSKMRLKPGNDAAWTFSSEFNGNDSIERGASEISVRDINLSMTLAGTDSIKTVTINAYTGEGEKKRPVAGETVTIYVPRMFSLLPIGELTLDDSGAASLEFPSDLPGDKEGNLAIIAKMEENPTYGNVEKRETRKWGTPTDYSVPVTHRALWTKIAPRWMIYTLSVLLAGVWGHYLFAIISLIMIKINAKRKAREEYRI
jgi:hypothetical protein